MKQYPGDDKSMPLLDRLQELRDYLNCTDMPDISRTEEWEPRDWILAINLQLGRAAEKLHTFSDEETDKASPHFLAIAAVALDAVMAVEQSSSDESEPPEAQTR